MHEIYRGGMAYKKYHVILRDWTKVPAMMYEQMILKWHGQMKILKKLKVRMV